ncbi:mitochondrial 37S ribosomal protein rsm10 [Mycoemilia scoparia]|uniref:Mitochondrial 37S ribosomal protein rsm10 n=1 Tax=Mycoemilia scoparia TaxID=417184 RepID=A0A9W8DQI6_9FUNG|nr:mitochondrial 37S ribosomal protein rsm10 [Mycoemilia scoparia]
MVLQTFSTQTSNGFGPILDKVLGTKRGEIENFITMDKVDPIYQDPVKIKPTHGITVLTIQFQAHSLHRIDFYMDFCRHAAAAMKIPCTGVIRFPTSIKRWTVLKSPFVHKSSMEVFERRTHKRFLKIHDTHPETLKKWLDYVVDNIPAGVGIRTHTYEFSTPGIGEELARKISATKKINESNLLSRGRRVRPPPLRYWNIEGMASKVAQALAEDPRANIEKVTAKIIEEMKPKTPPMPKKEEKTPPVPKKETNSPKEKAE